MITSSINSIRFYFTKVGKVLGSHNGTIKSELIKLLKDDSEEVLQGLVPNLAQTLDLLTQSQTIGTDQMVRKVLINIR